MSSVASQLYSIPMKGSGFYNSHSELQRGLLIEGLNLLRQAAVMASQNTLSLNTDARQVVEYGSSHGRNSIEPLQTILEVTSQTDVIIYLDDRPENDFNSLASTMDKWQAELDVVGERHRCFINLLPRSFYKPLHYARMIDLGFSFTCLHFLENMPSRSDYYFTAKLSEEVQTALRLQAQIDLTKFLSLRAAEFVPGGMLLISLICPGINRPNFFESGPGEASRMALREMAADGVLDETDLTTCVIPVFFRTLNDVEATLEDLAVQQKWILTTVTQSEVYHPLWNEQDALAIENKRNKEHRRGYANAMILWFWAVFEGFVVRAFQNNTREPRDASTVKYLVDETKSRAIKIFAAKFSDTPVFLPSTFVLLERRL